MGAIINPSKDIFARHMACTIVESSPDHANVAIHISSNISFDLIFNTLHIIIILKFPINLLLLFLQ